jgi:hydrogenase nickel incorporation protein HypA/HybF
MSIATALMDQLTQIAQTQRVQRIVAVEVICGEMQQVVPDALHLAFEAVTAETIAAGATLTIVEQALAARCRACGAEFAPQIDDYLCPACGQADVELTAGRDIVLQSVVGETEDEATG